MENSEAQGQSLNQPSEKAGTTNVQANPDEETGRKIMAQSDEGSCGSCGAGTERSYVFAIGRVEARFPSLAVEKEFSQATSLMDTAGLTDRETLNKVLSDRANRYILRRLCWVFTIEGLENYILMPYDTSDYDLLIEAIRPAPSPLDVDVVIGARGSIAPVEMCNGLMVPIVIFNQLYSFDRDALIQGIPKPETIKQEKLFRVAAEELFDRISQMTDNAGATDEHRALNYLAVRYPAIYTLAAEAFGRNSSLTAVEVRPSRLSGTRRIVDVIFSYTSRETDVTERYFVRVDVTEEFPFLVSKLSPYYER